MKFLNQIQLRSKSILLAALAFVLLAMNAVPASAATTGVTIRVKVGSTQMKINTEIVKITAPYLSSGNVMVPLSVFTNTKGFGAKLQLTNNKVIKLTYGTHNIVLTVGQKSATIDGKKATVPAAPANKSGVMTVPLASVIKAFGKTVTQDAKTKEYVINGVTSASGTSGNKPTGIDSDSGKSLIGDSYYQWSMNYPTGLVQGYVSSSGNWITFGDVKGDYRLALSVEETSESMDSKDQRDYIIDNFIDDEQILDVSTIKKPGGTFQKVVTKYSDTTTEYRGIQANDHFYTVILTKKGKAASNTSAYAALLDSFKPSFDASNKSLKDLTKVKNGLIAFEDKAYGLQINLPVKWVKHSESNGLSFVGPDDAELTFEVTSSEPGDTLDQWVASRQKMYEDLMNSDYRAKSTITPTTWNGVPALLLEISYTDNLKDWTNEYSIFVMNGKHKLELNLTYPQKDKDKIQTIFEQMSKNMKVDLGKIEKDFGYLPDSNDIELRETTEKTSKKYGYRITVPKYWARGVDMERSGVLLEGIGVSVRVAALENGNLTEMLDKMDKYANSGLTGTIVESRTKETFAGVEAYKFVEKTLSGAETPTRTTTYLFEKAGTVYLVLGVIEDMYTSELNVKQLQDALASFKWTSN
ncbi:copper amine oxidase N-terminal domain-containing protein [Cohnella soli]|uniref:Copper amine oxidase N-terminal domain-containing protein n=1 Tax=Cohnella soli TaxID=425005 RepID=A0ABW0HPA2_9BACL